MWRDIGRDVIFFYYYFYYSIIVDVDVDVDNVNVVIIIASQRAKRDCFVKLSHTPVCAVFPPLRANGSYGVLGALNSTRDREQTNGNRQSG